MKSSLSVILLIAVAAQFSMALQYTIPPNSTSLARLSQAANFSNTEKTITLNSTEGPTSTSITTTKNNERKRRALETKDKASQTPEQGTKKPSLIVNKAETKKINGEKLSKGLQDNVTVESQYKSKQVVDSAKEMEKQFADLGNSKVEKIPLIDAYIQHLMRPDKKTRSPQPSTPKVQ